LAGDQYEGGLEGDILNSDSRENRLVQASLDIDLAIEFFLRVNDQIDACWKAERQIFRNAITGKFVTGRDDQISVDITLGSSQLQIIKTGGLSMFATLLAVLFAAILGLAILLFGYRLFLVMLPIWGFFAGFWLGASAISLLIGQGFLATITGWVVGFIVGVILAVLSYLFYMLAVALIAAVIGGALASALMTAIGFDPGFLICFPAYRHKYGFSLLDAAGNCLPKTTRGFGSPEQSILDWLVLFDVIGKYEYLQRHSRSCSCSI